ncbi:MAG: SDR family NAD(P)-dependent oxidoreductase, partial [Phycisphaerales bacterium]|nr:SDR family NAD(P)-dependent oxidoreductase [Phycisphaerales bacterium]
MSVCIEGKTILITGASSGIGEATARACVSAGMRCVMTARREDKLRSLADELGDCCSFVVGDVTEAGFNEYLLKQSGDLYAVFANAGHGLDQNIADYNSVQFQELFQLNVFAAVELASLAANEIMKKKQGHILFCASCLSKFATPSHGAYCASKSALEAFATSTRMELKHKNIFVSTVHPIGTRTEFFDASATRSGKGVSTFESQTPSWLMQPPEKVANAIVRCLRRPKPEIWT